MCTTINESQNKCMEIFSHLFRLPCKGRGTGVFILISNKNKTIFTVLFPPCFVEALGNIDDIPCGLRLA